MKLFSYGDRSIIKVTEEKKEGGLILAKERGKPLEGEVISTNDSTLTDKNVLFVENGNTIKHSVDNNVTTYIVSNTNIIAIKG